MAEPRKVFISSDMEGTAGIVDWQQCLPGSPDYELGRRLLLAEVNAAIDGALDAGATEILVNDSHSSMRNLPADALRGRAAYLSGSHKPLYMMQGLDPSFDAVFFVSYHGAMGSASNLSHTYNPGAIAEVRCNGVPVGESGLNALVAQEHGVPIALITGDQVVGPEAEPFCPGVTQVVVKESVNRVTASSLHPEVACERIRAGAADALRRVAAGEIGAPRIDLPAELAVDFLTADMAEMATWIRGVERTAPRTAVLRDESPLRLYRTFVTLVYLTRSIVEKR
jgi:D-amino peptidase